jgi:hypothetical protein
MAHLLIAVDMLQIPVPERAGKANLRQKIFID